jgi:tetratricopeptide (TPR) repeat protein
MCWSLPNLQICTIEFYGSQLGMGAKQTLDHGSFEGIRVEAFKHPLLDVLGGPVIRDPAFAHLRHRRQNRPWDTFDDNARFEKYLSGEWVYIGPKYDHFGHIMAEMVHRIVPSKVLLPGDHKWLLVTTFDDAESGFDSLCSTFQEVLEFCQIGPDRVKILNSNTVVEKLFICEQGSHFGGRPTAWYLDSLAEFSKRRLDQIHGSKSSAKKVYVSKSKIPHGGTLLGESYIEGLLRDEGFLVFHPQDAPLSLQMDVYRKAKDLVFLEGSACHGTELLGKKMLGRTCVLIRRMETRAGLARILEPRSEEFQLFPDTFNLGTVVVHRGTRHPHSEFSVSLADIDRLVEFFRAQRLARLDEVSVSRYFEAAEADLRAYFSYQMNADLGDVDPWRIGEVRLEFEKLRCRFLAGRQRTPLDSATQSDEPEDAKSIEERAWAAQRDKKWLEAARCWDLYRQHFPNAGEGFALGSIALIELGRFYEADALLRLAMEKFPDYPDVYSNYAWVAHHRRDWRETVARWEAFRVKFPEMMVGYAMGATALCELGRYSDADEVIRLGLERHPDDETLLEKYAWTAHISQNESEARKRWRVLMTAYPKNQAGLRHGQEPSLQGNI